MRAQLDDIIDPSLAPAAFHRRRPNHVETDAGIQSKPDRSERPLSAAPPGVAELLRALVRAMCGLLMRIEVEGRQHLPSSGPAVVVFNHLSVADGPLLVSLLPRPGAFLVAREFERIPLVGWWIRKVAAPIYIDRRVPGRRWVVRARRVLDAGQVLCLAPEGRVSQTGALVEARNGAAFVASAAGASLVPVAISGQEKFWRQWLRLRRPRVRVVVGDPFTLPDDEAGENTRYLMQRIAALLPVRYQGFYRLGCGHV
jgi:1-acyl-sn-glycerol-3-phosphate acyltransferase